MNSGVDALDELSVIEKARNDLREFSEQGMVVSREMKSLKYIEKGLDLLDIGSQESLEK